VEGVLLRPLPFPDPTGLVTLGDTIEGANFGGGAPYATAPEIGQYMRSTTSFSSLGAYRQTGYELSGLGEPAQISASRLTASIFPTLAVSAMIGRPFTQREDDESRQVAVISYQMWRSRFHGDATSWPEDPARPQTLRGRRRHAPRIRVSLVPGQLNRSELWVPMSLTPGSGRRARREAGTS